MSIQFPGSVLSRALRSRLIQQRLSKTRPYLLANSNFLAQSRLYSTADTAADHTTPSYEHETPDAPPPVRYISKRERTKRDAALSAARDEKAREAEGRLLMAIASGGRKGADDTPHSRGGSSISYKAIEMELQWLADPRALADRVGRLLQAGDAAMAAALVRQAQRDGQDCEVAWNHLLRHFLHRGHPDAAFKLYNDMKKRGRMPTERTYTIMLKGLSSAPTTRGIVETAYSVYRSITAKNSTVELNIFHTNAMLLVCQRHGDMDMLWRVAGDLPEEGDGAPNMTTYSIILGALHHAARKDVQAMDASEVDAMIERKEQMVKEGKRIWADVIYRWTHDRVPIDNQVVGAMARLLLEGAHDHDIYDVFALYHQTMGIPILSKVPEVNPKVSRRRVRFQTESRRPTDQELEDVPFVDQNNKVIRNRDEAPPDIDDEEGFDSLFDPVVPNSEDLVYGQPGNRGLSLILDACMKMTQGASLGTAYWDHLTRGSTDYPVEPDQHSFNQYLRLLRITRSSKTAVRLVREQMFPTGEVTGKSLHIALSCCRRDRRNPQVLTYANELLGVMNDALVIPDTRILQGYLDLVQALSADPHTLLHLEGLKEGKKKTKKGTQSRFTPTLGQYLQAELRVRAIEAMRPLFHRLHEAMEHGKPPPLTRWSESVGKNGAMNGADCVSTMAWIRTTIDETLKDTYARFVSNADRKLLQEDSNLLKTYSDKTTIQKFGSRFVHPTVEQRNEHTERWREILESRRRQPEDALNKVIEEMGADGMNLSKVEEAAPGAEEPSSGVEATSGVEAVPGAEQVEGTPNALPQTVVDSPEAEEANGAQSEGQAESSPARDIKQ